LVGRFFITLGQLIALTLGGIHVYLAGRTDAGLGIFIVRVFWGIFFFFASLFLDRKLIREPFPVQFRARLERLGPTYIKLGQILSLREDLLPRSITDELKNLLDRLPVVSFDRFKQLIQADLNRPLHELFRWIDPNPLGSASLAQTHRARLLTGERVALKVLKPGVRQTVETDTTLLRLFGRWLQIFLARYQPRQIIDEFCRYTLREVDLRFEADNAEAFAANFQTQPDVHFPKIYRHCSNRDVLCMEYFNGIKPDARAAALLTPSEKSRVANLGIGAILQMIFRDGFFHADLHPANLMIFQDASVGFIDLGMVGRLDRELQRRLFYYFYSLVMNEPENAARYLAAIVVPSKHSDVEGFRHALSGLYARWLHNARLRDFSVGQVILESVLLAGQYRIRFPGEVVLMVKALVTIEGVGKVIVPDLDIVRASRSHVQRLLLEQFNPVEIAKASLLFVPEIVDVMNRSPLVMSEGLKQMESNLKRPPQTSREGQGWMILAAACIVAAAILYSADAPWFVWTGLGVLALLGILRRQ
jgi:ubiquinone biosynthesis protein